MAQPTLSLIVALRATADRLDGGVRYQWSHMGSCNCGHLAQTLTKLTPRTIHRAALEGVGDWTEQAREYCPDTGRSLDAIVDTMVAAGLSTVDLANLERLLDDDVLQRIGERTPQRLPLDHRVREDAVLYLRTWADLLEERWRRGQERRGEEGRQPGQKPEAAESIL